MPNLFSLRSFTLNSALIAFVFTPLVFGGTPILGDEPLHITPYTGDQGCWVSLFAGKNYGSPQAQLTGPTYIEKFKSAPVIEPSLRHVGGEGFLQQVNSIIVGPRAIVIGYRNEQYDEKTLTLRQNQKVPDLNAIGFHDQVRSIKVQCSSNR